MEKEICRRETSKKITKIFKWLAYGFGVFSALALTVTLFVTAIDSAWEYLLTDSSFTIPLFIVAVSAVLTVFCIQIDRKTGIINSFLVLTNKRIYCQIATAKIKQIESYNLNTITYYRVYQRIVKGEKRFTLIFKTPTDTAKFIIDEEFYSEFVNAINATVNVII